MNKERMAQIAEKEAIKFDKMVSKLTCFFSIYLSTNEIPKQ